MFVRFQKEGGGAVCIAVEHIVAWTEDRAGAPALQSDGQAEVTVVFTTTHDFRVCGGIDAIERQISDCRLRR